LYISVLCTILGMVGKESASFSMISYTMKTIFNSHNGRREDHHQRQYLSSLESKKTNNETWFHCTLTFSFILLTMIVVVLQVVKNHKSHLCLMICLKVSDHLVMFSITKIIMPFTRSSCICRQQIESIYSWMWKVNESAYCEGKWKYCLIGWMPRGVHNWLTKSSEMYRSEA
jgi:hypothetical protein